MNNLSYEDALEILKVYESIQRKVKVDKNKYAKFLGNSFVGQAQCSINKNKVIINYLLSIIHAHKTARKLYAENYRLKKAMKGV